MDRVHIANGKFQGLNPYAPQPIIWMTGVLTMESIMEQIRTRLQGGESPQELIKKGFKRTTVYSIAKKMEGQLKENNDEKSIDRDIFLALIIKEAIGWTMDDMHFDGAEEPKRWKSVTSLASDQFEQLLGKKPPEDFLNATL